MTHADMVILLLSVQVAAQRRLGHSLVNMMLTVGVFFNWIGDAKHSNLTAMLTAIMGTTSVVWLLAAVIHGIDAHAMQTSVAALKHKHRHEDLNDVFMRAQKTLRATGTWQAGLFGASRIMLVAMVVGVLAYLCT